LGMAIAAGLFHWWSIAGIVALPSTVCGAGDYYLPGESEHPELANDFQG
jgi:hypothetical protein